MKVSVVPHSTLQSLVPEATASGTSEIELPENATCETLLERLGITHRRSILIVLNGRRRRLEEILCDDDRVELVPAVGGG